MSGAPVLYALLFICWISALVTLVIFLESWFALTRRSRLGRRRSSGAGGVVSVLAPMGVRAEASRRTLLSVLEQSYPFIELLPIYTEGDAEHLAVLDEIRSVRSHVPIRPAPVAFVIDDEAARIRALDQAQSAVRGAWILVLDPDVVLDEFAVESALEFASGEDLTAVALTPGVECRSLWQRLLAPSLEWFVRMIQVVDRGKEKSAKAYASAPFMLLHGHTHTVINRMNRLPGILNESGWTLWSYRVEGLRTFQGDGSGWIAREATPWSLMSRLNVESLSVRRVAAFVFGSAAISIVSVLGIIVGLVSPEAGFAQLGILYFSVFSYSLMATSYFCYSRRLGAATWFAPFWFFAHAVAFLLTLGELRRSQRLPGAARLAAREDSKVPTRDHL